MTDYLDMYEMTPRQLGIEVMNAVLDRTGIRSTCGIGTNLYLAKIALDITAKNAPDYIGILYQTWAGRIIMLAALAATAETYRMIERITDVEI